MTSTSPSSSPTQSTLLINSIKNMTTCTSGLITWTYNGSSANLILSITNVNVLDPYSLGNLTRRQNSAGDSVSMTLTDAIATSNSWTWPQVNVSQGWYQVQGNVTPLSAVSSAFFISNGSDTSCLLASSSTSSPASTTSPTADVNYSDSPNLNGGKIAGIVIGVLAGLAITALAIAYYFRRRRRPSRGNLQRHNPRESMGRWSSLKSNSSTIKSLAATNPADLSTVHSDATELADEIQISVADITSHVGHKIEPNHLSQSTTLSDPMYVPPSSYNRHMSLSNPPPTSVNTRQSRRVSELNFEQQAARIRSSMDTSMFLRTERMSLPAFPRTPALYRGVDDPLSPASATFQHRGRDEYPPSPVTPRGRDEYPPSARAAVSRSPSTSTATRRTPRKPVPHYDPAELSDPRGLLDAQAILSSDDLQGTSPLPSSPRDTPSLSPKSSFGNHPRIHYLIPDMPSPRPSSE
ncbi:hypothetical protein K503DRAFT_63071 [Rhizopogon vinicolor AM-OR11-026]|uniref:Uncharacterized protein n=1 Tax=Rhizopogon vinicolor AM-OR11-026 TaxID=1314800 RepID=A0A1B7N4A9_9AGAM|nr:hypothetical protein K503DRAFT_63071 [Rhizopogon vinicolor AM-OR11-026]